MFYDAPMWFRVRSRLVTVTTMTVPFGTTSASSQTQWPAGGLWPQQPAGRKSHRPGVVALWPGGFYPGLRHAIADSERKRPMALLQRCGVTYKATDPLTLTTELNLVRESFTPANGLPANGFGAAQYASCSISGNWVLNGRIEYWRDDTTSSLHPFSSNDSHAMSQQGLAWQKERNKAKACIKWMFTTGKARTKLARAHPNPVNES
jgi:hypothetical protein